MSDRKYEQPDPERDLILERVVDVAPELVWAAWTKPEHIKKWFTPAPWTTVDCEIDLWPGGNVRTVMRSPEGKEFPNEGCYLEIVENKKLVWTGALASVRAQARVSRLCLQRLSRLNRTAPARSMLPVTCTWMPTGGKSTRTRDSSLAGAKHSTSSYCQLPVQSNPEVSVDGCLAGASRFP
jgi:uncharacterized protein YndB with AHSA1/START domain